MLFSSVTVTLNVGLLAPLHFRTRCIDEVYSEVSVVVGILVHTENPDNQAAELFHELLMLDAADAYILAWFKTLSNSGGAGLGGGAGVDSKPWPTITVGFVQLR